MGEFFGYRFNPEHKLLTTMTKEAKQQIVNWLDTLQDGDKIVVHGDYITLYNSCGCELDTVTMSGYQVQTQFKD